MNVRMTYFDALGSVVLARETDRGAASFNAFVENTRSARQRVPTELTRLWCVIVDDESVETRLLPPAVASAPAVAPQTPDASMLRLFAQDVIDACDCWLLPEKSPSERERRLDVFGRSLGRVFERWLGIASFRADVTAPGTQDEAAFVERQTKQIVQAVLSTAGEAFSLPCTSTKFARNLVREAIAYGRGTLADPKPRAPDEDPANVARLALRALGGRGTCDHVDGNCDMVATKRVGYREPRSHDGIAYAHSECDEHAAEWVMRGMEFVANDMEGALLVRRLTAIAYPKAAPK